MAHLGKNKKATRAAKIRSREDRERAQKRAQSSDTAAKAMELIAKG